MLYLKLVKLHRRSEQILAAGAVDAAVATDDVETLSDLIFDEVSDQDRLAAIEWL